MTGPDGERYEFDPGSFCLELLLTGGPGPHRRHESLCRPADLAAWIAGSRLARYGPLPAGQVRVRRPQLLALVRFRDTMWAALRKVAHGESPTAAELELINACTATALRPALAPDTGEPCWATPVSGTQILGTAARDAVELIGSRSDRLRECEANDCYLLFLDTSRPGARRWCSMRRCGNRHKVKAYRSRQDDS